MWKYNSRCNNFKLAFVRIYNNKWLEIEFYVSMQTYCISGNTTASWMKNICRKWNRMIHNQELVEQNHFQTDIMLCDGLRFSQFLSRFIELKRTWFEWLRCFWSKWFINLYWQDWAWNENILIPRRNDNQSLKSLNDKYRVDRFSYFI